MRSIRAAAAVAALILGLTGCGTMTTAERSRALQSPSEASSAQTSSARPASAEPSSAEPSSAEPSAPPSTGAPTASDTRGVLVAASGVILAIGTRVTLCTGAMLLSLPPAGCGGPALGLGSTKLSSLAHYTDFQGSSTKQAGPVGIVGWWDGRQLTVAKVVAAGEIPAVPRATPDLGTACRDTGGADVHRPSAGPSGPVPGDAGVAAAAQAAIDYADAQPDLGQVWYSEDMYVVNAAFTGDLARHRSAMRALYSGPLCVIASKYTLNHLRQLQERLVKDLRGADGQRLPFTGLGASLDRLDVSVLFSTAADVAALRAATIPELYVRNDLTAVTADSPLRAGIR